MNTHCTIYDKVKKIIQANHAVFASSKFDVGKVKNYEARIKLNENKFIARKPYKCSIDDKKEIENQIKELLKADLIEESYSPYAAPVLLVLKKEEGKKTQLCINYKDLNDLIVPECQPFPRIEDLTVKAGKCKYFTKLDINSAFWSIPIRKKDRYKSAFVTHNGHWQWKRLAFELKIAPSIFQRILSSILRKYNLSSFTVNYIDDMMIFSRTYEEHLEHIRLVLRTLLEEGFKLNFAKCIFAQKKVTYLGHVIGENYIQPINDNLKAIKDFLTPKTKKQVRQFLGKINFYLEFIPKRTILLEPLHNLLRKNVDFVWSSACLESFEKVKSCLCSKPILAIFNPEEVVKIFTDASVEGVGATLKQPQADGSMKPVFYFSKKLTSTQKTKKAIFLECLAIKEAVLYWQYYLIGKKFFVYTDHKPLENFNVRNSDDKELLHMLNFLSQFEFEILYNPGKDNVGADCLSRNPVMESDDNHEKFSVVKISNFLTLDEIKKDQESLIKDGQQTADNGLI